MAPCIDNPADKSPSRLWWSDFNNYGKLEKQLIEYDQDTGPGQYYKILQSIRPEIFFSTSQSPFHCKELLPRWARLRCIHIFNYVLMTNDDETRELHLPGWAEVFQTNQEPYPEYWEVPPLNLIPQDSKAGKFLRGAIQLRPTLERLSSRLGGRDLSGEDITTYATSLQEDSEDKVIQWTEDWNYARSVETSFTWHLKFKEGDKDHLKEARDLSSVYKEWLQDPQLAEEVARSYNQGVREHGKVAYPFCHSDYPGQVYFETSLCESRNGKVWLGRPKHRGSYSNINIEGRKRRKMERRATSRVLERYYSDSMSPYAIATLHPHLRKVPFHRPSK